MADKTLKAIIDADSTLREMFGMKREAKYRLFDFGLEFVEQIKKGLWRVVFEDGSAVYYRPY